MPRRPIRAEEAKTSKYPLKFASAHHRADAHRSARRRGQQLGDFALGCIAPQIIADNPDDPDVLARWSIYLSPQEPTP